MRFLSRTAVKTLMVFSAFAILLSSCNNEEEAPLPDQEIVEEPENNLADSLNAAFARQIKAMNSLVTDETVGVTSCKALSDGTFQVALMGGASFVSYPDDVEYFGVLSYLVVGEETVWALLDKGGNPQALKNDAGKMMPISAEPKLIKGDTGYILEVNGIEFATAFGPEDKVQAFKCTFHKDEASDVYAVTLDFGAELQKTFIVENYAGVSFSLPYVDDPVAISEFYVNYSSTSSLLFNIPDGISYDLKVTEGWTAFVRKADDNTYIDLTAPAKTDAVSPAILEVVSEQAGVVLAQIALSNEPFHSVFASSINVVVNPSVGVWKFVYGLSLQDDFVEDAVISIANEIAAGGAVPAGCGVSDVAVSVPFTELLGADLNPEERYVVWAIPVLYDEKGEWSIDALTLYKNNFSTMSFNIELKEARLLDADIKVEVKGANAVFGGVVEKSDEAMEDILFQLNNSILDSIPVTGQTFMYEGLMSDFPVVDEYKNDCVPETTYLVWVSAAYSGDYTYSASDVYAVEVTTNKVVEGGDLTVSFGDVQVGRSTISVPIKSEGAAMIYYALLNSSDGGRYSSDEVPNDQKYEQIKKRTPVAVKGSEVVASLSKLNPNTSYWVYAVAVDEDGRYGTVSCISGKTEALVYDQSITLNVELKERTAKKFVLEVTSNGGDLSDYIYWTGRATDPFWANSTYCGGTSRTAQKYMALNPDDENITRVMNKYGEIASDGTIVIDELTMETEYIFAILEKGEENFSPIGYIKVTTLAADLGEIVREGTAQWESAKASVTLDWIQSAFVAAENSSMMASYGFNFSCPKDLTAYVMCGSDTYFSSAGITKVEHVMIEIENYASRRYDFGKTPVVNGEHVSEPDYYKDGELKEGQLMNVYDFCVHGVPSMGFVTYFAEGSHGEGNCIYWENDGCSAYKYAQDCIDQNNTLAPWQTRAEMFGLKDKEASDWAQALLEAYSVYYKDAKPVIYENTGAPLRMYSPYATGKNEEGIIPDRVIVMLKDLQGNYYEPMFFEVPDYFN